jgi:hypothetical protein
VGSLRRCAPTLIYFANLILMNKPEFYCSRQKPSSFGSRKACLSAPRPFVNNLAGKMPAHAVNEIGFST